jgi:deazaflavin-dependent oxidoreductase (nitroreductase family)
MKLIFQFFIALHVWIYRRTGGKVWGQEGGNDVLLVTTIGRKSGKKRINPVCYVPDDNGYLVLASAAGAPKHPGWYWNAVKGSNPVNIQVKDKQMQVHVTELTGPERENCYEAYKQAIGVEQINGYEKKASHRTFPLLRLSAL